MTTTLKYDLPLEAIRTLCRRYPVRELAVFGSVLRDDFRADSDIDMLVEFEPNAPVGMLMLARMQRELSEILKRKQSVLDSAQVIYAN